MDLSGRPPYLPGPRRESTTNLVHQECMTQIVLETLNVPATYVANQDDSSLYAVLAPPTMILRWCCFQGGVSTIAKVIVEDWRICPFHQYLPALNSVQGV